MLPKPQSLLVYTKTRQEKIHSPNEITKSLVIDNSLIRTRHENAEQEQKLKNHHDNFKH